MMEVTHQLVTLSGVGPHAANLVGKFQSCATAVAAAGKETGSKDGRLVIKTVKP